MDENNFKPEDDIIYLRFKAKGQFFRSFLTGCSQSIFFKENVEQRKFFADISSTKKRPKGFNEEKKTFAEKVCKKFGTNKENEDFAKKMLEYIGKLKTEFANAKDQKFDNIDLVLKALNQRKKKDENLKKAIAYGEKEETKKTSFKEALHEINRLLAQENSASDENENSASDENEQNQEGYIPFNPRHLHTHEEFLQFLETFHKKYRLQKAPPK